MCVRDFASRVTPKPCGCGTVYSFTPQGDYAQLYAFQGGADGAQPNGTLTVRNGVLYGSTAAGGASNAGTVVYVTLEGVESTLHAFSGSTDGAQPNTLIKDGTNLYATTSIGAGTGCALSKGCGTVFMINPQAGETTLYAFGTANSGGNPHGRLLKLGDDLYGTPIAGGKYNDGTVFSVSVMGVAKLLHSFDGCDGAAPYSALTDLSGTL